LDFDKDTTGEWEYVMVTGKKDGEENDENDMDDDDANE